MNALKKINLTLLFLCLFISFSINTPCSFYGDEENDPLRGGGTGSFTCTGEIPWMKVITNAAGLYIFGVVSHKMLEGRERSEV